MKKYLLFSLGSLLLHSFTHAQCGAFVEDFESGSTTPTWTNLGTATPTVVTSPVALGTYALELVGGGGHLQGISTTIPTMTPDEISWYIYPTGTDASHYVVTGDGTTTANNCISFCYWQGSGGNIRFYSNTGFNMPVAPNQWYQVAMRNIDWINRTFDIYLDNVLQTTAFPFRSTTINTLSQIHLYNLAGNGNYDEIIAGNAPISFDLTGTNVSCNGAGDGAIDATIYNAQGPVTYNWSNAEITEDISGLSPGWYTLDVIDSAGCTDIDSLEITEPMPIVAMDNTISPSICSGLDGSIDLIVNGGVPGYTYSWNTGDTTSSLSGISEGTYDVTVTDLNNCTAQWTYTLTDPAPPMVSISWPTMNTCNYYAPFALTGESPSGGIWSGAGVSTSMFDPATASLGSNTIIYEYTDSLNCMSSDTAEIIVSECLGLDEVTGSAVKVFPNPTHGQVHIELDKNYGVVTLQLLSVSGELVLAKSAEGIEFVLNTENIPAGVYFLQIRSESQEWFEKLTID